MNRRGFVAKAIGIPLVLSVPGLAMAQAFSEASGLPSISTTHTTDFLGTEPPIGSSALAQAADAAYNRFRETVGVSGEFVARSHGMLIFPQVVRAGLVVGMAQGDGLLVARGIAPRIYRQQSSSFGLQAGGQRYSQVYVFMQPKALAEFLSDPAKWNVGIDATIAVAYAGAQDSVDTAQLNQPVVVFTFDNEGLMAGVSLSATKIFPQT